MKRVICIGGSVANGPLCGLTRCVRRRWWTLHCPGPRCTSGCCRPGPADRRVPMKVGISALFQNLEASERDFAAYAHQLTLAELAEPLGYDSIWAVEHHFSGY